jgi:hypothetical protein
MGLVATLRRLSRRRLLLALGLAAALAAGALGWSRGGAPRTGGAVASMQLMLDTTDSQLVEDAPAAAETLTARAGLLADALASADGTAAIARTLGVPAWQVAVLGPTADGAPPAPSPLSDKLSVATAVPATPYVVHVVPAPDTPMLSIVAYGPGTGEAARLAAGTAAGLQSLLVSADASGSRGFVLDTVSATRTRVLRTPSRRRAVAVAGALALACLWCGLLAVAPAPRRSRFSRRAAARAALRRAPRRAPHST